MSDDLKISQRAAELARGQELAEAIASALGTSLRHYMPATKEKAVETATMFLAKVEGAALSPSQDDGLVEALRPFAEYADFYNDCEQHPNGCPDTALCGEVVDLTVGDFRRARKALRKAGAL